MNTTMCSKPETCRRTCRRRETPYAAARCLPATLACALWCALCAGAWGQQPPGAGTQPIPSAGTILNQQTRPVPGASPPGSVGALPAAPALPPAAAGAGTFALRGIRLTGNETLASAVLLPLVTGKIGQQVGLTDLNDMAARLADAYRERGYALAQVVVPPQDVTGGDVTFTVLEGKIGRVNLNVAAGTPVRESLLRARLAAIQPGRPLLQRDLERTMLLLSDLPGVHVTSALEAGSVPGTVDLTVNVEPAKRWEFGVSLDDYGARQAGRWRVGMVGRLNSPFGIGDNVDVNLLWAQRSDTWYGRIGYDAPVGSDGTRVGIAYSHLYYALGQNFAPLNAQGNADVVTGSVSYPLVRSRSQNLLLRGAIEYRSLTDNVGVAGFTNPQKLTLGSVGLSYESRDGLLGGGFNSAEAELSAGHLEIGNAEAGAIDQAPGGRHTAGNSVRMTMLANRLNAITEKWSVFFGVSGQWANQNLDSSSRIALGGPHAVRAYSPDEAVVDEGLIATASLRYAVVPALTLSAFFDIGTGRYNARSIPGQGANTVTRSGAGLAAYWAGPAGITVDGSLAWRTTRADTTGDDKLPRLYVQFSKAF